MPSRPLISADRLAALVLLIVFAAYGLYGHTFESSLGVDVVGPGFYPSVIGIFGVVLSALMLTRREPTPTEPREEGENRDTLGEIRVFTPVAMMLAYVLTLDSIGFPIATLVFLALTIRFLGCPTWFRSVAFALIGTVGAVALFHYGLELRLPQGDLIRFW